RVSRRKEPTTRTRRRSDNETFRPSSNRRNGARSPAPPSCRQQVRSYSSGGLAVYCVTKLFSGSCLLRGFCVVPGLFQIIPFQFALQRSSVDAENTRGCLFVAAGSREHPQDVPPFQFGSR